MLRITTVLFLVISSSAFADTARIATWNLGGFFQIPQSKLDNIIAGLEELDADIIVLPELNPASHAELIADELSTPADECYDAVVPDQPRANQKIGILFKCDVDVSSDGIIIGSDLDRQGYRNAAVAHAIVGEFDFVLIGLHLKAGRGAQNRNLRNEQLKIISAYVQGVLVGGEHDVLIIGDYNMIPGEDDTNFDTLNADMSLRYVSSEDLANSFSHISTSGGAGNLLDGYGFTDVGVSEYQNSSVEIFDMHTTLNMTLIEYRDEVTDHLPVVAEFNIDNDND